MTIEITEIILRSSFHETSLNYLEQQVAKFCFLYRELFGPLKPKMHFMTHLSTSIRAMGPPRNYMCFKMEEKHRFYKIYAHIMPNRKNISLSFAKKYQYKFAYILFKNEKYARVNFGKLITTRFQELNLINRTFYEDMNYKGTLYKPGKYLPLREGGSLILYRLQEICVTSNRLFMVVEKIANGQFDSHLHSFILNRNVQADVRIIAFEEFESIPINIYKLDNNIEIFRPRHFFDAFEDIDFIRNIH